MTQVFLHLEGPTVDGVLQRQPVLIGLAAVAEITPCTDVDDDDCQSQFRYKSGEVIKYYVHPDDVRAALEGIKTYSWLPVLVVKITTRKPKEDA